MIRKLIKRWEAALATMGRVCAAVSQIPGQPGRPATAYHLNKPQVLFVISKAETAKAVEVTVAMIEKFVAYEAGLIQPKAALPDFSNPALAARAWADEYEADTLKHTLGINPPSREYRAGN